MLRRTIFLLSVFASTASLCATGAFAQGGWDVWTIHLRDGSTQSAAPVWSLDNKVLKRGFMEGGKPDDKGIERSLINYISNNLGNSEYRRKMGSNYIEPALPKGNTARDVVVYDDGRQAVGDVTIRPERDASGKENIYRPLLVQNGAEVDLTKVAHIKFAAPKANPGKPKQPPGRRR
jgi:hypothetical protein